MAALVSERRSGVKSRDFGQLLNEGIGLQSFSVA
jgi:hypothetical protein